MLNYEKAIIKQYKRKLKNSEKNFNQINLGYNSKFEHEDKVIIIKEDDFNNLLDKVELAENLEVKLNDANNELESLRTDNREYSNQILELTGRVKELDIIKNNYDKAIDELESLRTDNRELKSDKKELLNKLDVANAELNHEKELKSNIVMRYEGIISEIQNKIFFRLLCNLPKSYKELHATEIKEIVEVENK